MNRSTFWMASAFTLSISLISASLPLVAQSDSQPQTKPADQPVAAEQEEAETSRELLTDNVAEQPTEDQAEQIRRQLLLKRKKPPMIEPTRRPDIEKNLPQAPTMPAATVNIDPSVLGIAPGEKAPPLQPDGTFIVNRRGRLISSPEGLQIFIFESDGRETPERPLILQPCKKLEGMETIVQELGDKVIFTISGQVFLYRNNNYLLPTLFTVDYERDNISK